MYDLAPGEYGWSYKPFGGVDMGFSYPDKAINIVVVPMARRLCPPILPRL